MPDRAALERALGPMSKEQRIAFIASCCERVVPLYLTFELDMGWGHYEEVRRSLDAVWRFLETSSIDKALCQAALRRSERWIPDEDDFPSPYLGLLEQAVGMMDSALRCCLDGDCEHAVVAALTTSAAISIYVDIVNAPLTGYDYLEKLLPESRTTSVARELILSRWRDLYDRFGTGLGKGRSWYEAAPLILVEEDRQEKDLEIISARALDLDLLGYLRWSSAMEGPQPIIRGLVSGRKRRR
jgi:uncharacterized protein YjaG (DUF416 family)